MGMFSAEKLVIMGSDLISKVYSELSSNQNVRELIMLFCEGCDRVDDDCFSKFVCHIEENESGRHLEVMRPPCPQESDGIP